MGSLPFSRVHERLSQPGSDVWAVHYQALARAEAGEDILLLSVGDPDFDTPDYISQHVIERIRAGRTHYSPAAGEPELREAIAKLERDGTGKPFDANQVVVFPGATATLFGACACILNPGDGIVVPEPAYIGYNGIFATLGADVQYVPLPAPRFELDVPRVMAAVRDNTKAVLVNTPGNPCGNIIPPDTLAELARACRARDLWLICDEVYSLITYEVPHVSMLKCTDDLSNIVVVDGLSKSHAMSGWRLGWAIADMPMATALTQFSGAALFGTSQFVQDGAAYALAHDAADVEIMRKAYEARRDHVLMRLDQIPQLGYFKPAAGMFVMIDVSAVAQDGMAFSQLLLEETGISTIPGGGFGPSGANYVRLSLTQDIPVLDDAFNRIEAMFAS